MAKARTNPPLFSLKKWVEEFVSAKRAEALSPKTIAIYSECLESFCGWCGERGVKTIGAVEAATIRAYMTYLEEQGRNAGGRHQAYRVIRTFVYWHATETDSPKPNIFQKARPPKIGDRTKDYADIERLRAMVEASNNGRHARRDRAFLRLLLDSGVRAMEICGLNIADVDLVTGQINVIRGKGRKSRATFIGQKARRDLRIYLREERGADSRPDSPLFLTETGNRFAYTTVKEILRRRSRDAGVEMPYPHSIRRGFATEMRRSGADLTTIQKLLGHTSPKTTMEYLGLTDGDLAKEHAQYSPSDRL